MGRINRDSHEGCQAVKMCAEEIFTFSGGNRCGGVAYFAAAIFLFFFVVVYWLFWFSLWKREGVPLNLKALLLSRLSSALLIDTLNLLG